MTFDMVAVLVVQGFEAAQCVRSAPGRGVEHGLLVKRRGAVGLFLDQRIKARPCLIWLAFGDFELGQVQLDAVEIAVGGKCLVVGLACAGEVAGRRTRHPEQVQRRQIVRLALDYRFHQFDRLARLAVAQRNERQRRAGARLTRILFQYVAQLLDAERCLLRVDQAQSERGLGLRRCAELCRLLQQFGRLLVALEAAVGAGHQRQCLGITRTACRTHQRFERRHGRGRFTHRDLQRRQGLACRHLRREEADVQLEILLGLDRPTEAEMRQAGDQRQMGAAGQHGTRQRINQPDHLAEQLARRRTVAFRFGDHRAQIGRARFVHVDFGQGQQGLLGLRHAPEIHQHRAAAEQGLAVVGGQLQRAVVVRQRHRQLCGRVGNGGTHAPGVGIIGGERGRLFGERGRLGGATGLKRDARLHHDRRRGRRIQRTRLAHCRQGLRILTQFQMRLGAQHDHFVTDAGRQIVRRQRVDHFLLAAGRHQQVRQRNDVLGTRHATLTRLVQRDLGRRVVALAQRGTSHEHVRGEEAGVGLQCVLELDDGAGVVLAFEADQGVLVVAAGSVGRLQRSGAKDADCTQRCDEGRAEAGHGRLSM